MRSMTLAALSSPSASTSTLRRNSSTPTPTDVWLSTSVVNSFSTLAHFVARDVLQARHRGADLLHFARAHVLEHLRRLLLAEGQQQDRGALGAVACRLRPSCRP